MKQGEIRFDPETGGFFMKTPTGIRSVTLRATTEGHVMVEEIAGGGIRQPIQITQMASAVDATNAHLDALRARMQARERENG